jgi:hypothetical protein
LKLVYNIKVVVWMQMNLLDEIEGKVNTNSCLDGQTLALAIVVSPEQSSPRRWQGVLGGGLR